MIFEKLKTISYDTEISVIGHKNPDVDSILSAILVSEYLKYLGFKAFPVILEDSVDKETLDIINKGIPNFKKYEIRNYLTKDIILVDHIKEYQNCNILGIIDHHPDFKVEKGFCYNEKACSTSCIFINLIQQKPYFKDFFNQEILALFLLSSLIDCDNFRNPKTTIEDKNLIEKYSDYYNYNYFRELADNETDISNIEYAISHGLKKYIMSEKNIWISYVNNSEAYDFYIERFSQEIRKNLRDDVYAWVLLITNTKTNSSKVIEVYHNETIVEIFDYLMSRGTNLVPSLEQKIKDRS